ncbi:MAG: hypothetical protein MK180_04880 [Rhodobacteraceae bacterium]|nr:hypothetical protein [Paracoccaceae bacterium]
MATFQWNVQALSPDANLDLSQLLGTHATISVESVEAVRYFDGLVTEARWIGPE